MSSENDSRSARERLVQVAARLFHTKGFANVGINEVFEKAAVSRGTLYYNFGSKKELILAVMQEITERRIAKLHALKAKSETPQAHLEHVIGDYFEQIRQRPQGGCSSLNAAIELGRQCDEVNEMALKLKEEMRQFLATLLKEAGYSDVENRSHQLQLIFNSALTTAVFRPADEVIAHSQALIDLLLREGRSSHE